MKVHVILHRRVRASVRTMTLVAVSAALFTPGTGSERDHDRDDE